MTTPSRTKPMIAYDIVAKSTKTNVLIKRKQKNIRFDLLEDVLVLRHCSSLND